MTTVNSLIADALKTAGIIGVGQTALAEDTNGALTLLNQLIARWRHRRLFVFGSADIAVPCTGQISYTIGAGGDINTTRPHRIEAAFIRQTNSGQNVDNPLTIVDSRIDYNRIALKTLGPYPLYVFYDPSYPLGTVYAWPIPSNIYELHLTLFRDIAKMALNQTISLPEEYEAAIYWNLAKNLRTKYRRPEDSAITLEARNTRQTIIQMNMAIPIAQMPAGLPGTAGHYNIYSDQGR